jgi:hypothetical protein
MDDVRQRVMLLTVLGLSLAAAAAAQPALEDDEADRVDTRYGPLVLHKIDTPTQTNWRISHNDRTLVETDYDALSLDRVVKGRDRDLVLVERATGGIACPYYYRVIEVISPTASIVSDEFGSCLQPRKARLYADALVIEMPAYTPHPELLTPQEIAERRVTTSVFTVRKGRITERQEVRR